MGNFDCWIDGPRLWARLWDRGGCRLEDLNRERLGKGKEGTHAGGGGGGQAEKPYVANVGDSKHHLFGP